MDFIKKNSAWIALAGLCLSVFIYYKVFMTKEDQTTGTKASFAGKMNVSNPVGI